MKKIMGMLLFSFVITNAVSAMAGEWDLHKTQSLHPTAGSEMVSSSDDQAQSESSPSGQCRVSETGDNKVKLETNSGLVGTEFRSYQDAKTEGNANYGCDFN